MKLLIFLTLKFLLISQNYVESANILYLSSEPSPSHFIWSKAILTSLHERGHNITVVSPDVEESKPNFTYLHLEKLYPTLFNRSRKVDFLKLGQMSVYETIKKFVKLGEIVCRTSMESDGYQKILNYPDNFKFDLVIHDFSKTSCILGLVHKFNYPPMISVSSALLTQKISLLSGGLIYPAFDPPQELEYPQNMNFVQRVVSAFFAVFKLFCEEFYLEPIDRKMLEKYHPRIPSPQEIFKKATKLIFVNTNPIIDYQQPTFANVKLVGGAQIRKPKELPEQLKKIFDEAKGPIVLFSLGTNARSDSLGEERILRFIKAFGRLPHVTFLWKFETKEKLPIEQPPNVKIESFMPQNDILAHPKTKLFMSHAGLLGCQEALWWGVPMIFFPIFGNQMQNAVRLKKKKIGETLSIHDYSEDQVYETITKMLEDPSYSKNMKTLSEAWQDQPMTPNEEATYWAEWILRHPDVDLRAPSLHQSIFVRHSLDVLGFFVLILIVIVVVVKKILQLIFKMFTSTRKVIQNVAKKKN